jgi:hypothetical protein
MRIGFCVLRSGFGGVVEDGGGEACGGVVEEAQGPADECEECGGGCAGAAVEGAVNEDPARHPGEADGVRPKDVTPVALHGGVRWRVGWRGRDWALPPACAFHGK